MKRLTNQTNRTLPVQLRPQHTETKDGTTATVHRSVNLLPFGHKNSDQTRGDQVVVTDDDMTLPELADLVSAGAVSVEDVQDRRPSKAST